ncbi:LysM peptidoglycan-binding domain-containing protein [Bradyrhizobium sp.]|uniref:LysM domain-containing protein n=1 Tax=Bradyrhizobium sp. TaxID=376 RepID=UPI003C725DFD
MVVHPMQVAAAVAGAMFFACISSASLDQALAQPIAASGDAAARTGAAVAAPSLEVATPPRGRVYLFRGALGPIFSRGMDRLTEKLGHAGIRADVYEFTICRLVAAQAVRDYRDDPAPVSLIGHSMGGLCALKFAEMFRDEDIPVSLVVTIDPAHASPEVPLNVERYINIFLSDGVLGGGDVAARQGYQGHYASFDLARQEEVTHINIEKMDSIHEQLVTAILRLAATPAKAEGKAVALRYVVPPNTPVELWDSGKALVARSGDTLQKLATLHRVPLWSLTQINQMPDSAALTAGQIINIPRHLMPATTIPAQPPPAARRYGARASSSEAGSGSRRGRASGP